MQIPPMPFKILALAPFRSTNDAAWSEGPIQIDKTNLDRIIDELTLSFYVPIPKDLCAAGGLDIRCKRLKDFHPDGLIQGNAFLKNLLDARGFVQEAKAKGLPSREIGMRLKRLPDLAPIQIKTEPLKPEKSSTSAVDNILKMVALPGESLGPPCEAQTLTDQIDVILQQILSHIFSHDEFRNLEAVWRGLRLLMQQGGIDGEIRLEIVPVSFGTLDETLDSITTGLIQDLPSLVIVDLPFDNSPRSIGLLERLARFSETLLVPVISWITSKFLNLDTWQDLGKLPFLPHYLEDPAFAKWRRLRESSSANWLAVTCNRFLVRYPYGIDNRPRLVPFEEHRRLWTSPVWAIGCLLAQSISRYGWPTRFTEWQRIRLKDLALNTEDPATPIPTEAAFSEDRIHQFIRGGIIPLVARHGQDVAFAPAESTLAGGSLAYQAFASRITQFLLWCKDNLRADIEPANIERDLREAFSLYWGRVGHPKPEGLEVSASPGPDDRIPLRITLKPSRQILPTGEKVEMEFVW